VIVVDVDAVAVDDLGAVTVPSGWTRRNGFELPDRPWDLSANRWICTGIVGDDQQAEKAMSALVRGVGLVVRMEGSSRFRLRVLDDLHHNGDVMIGSEPGGPVADLRPDDVALLRALSEGATVEEAARQVIMSPRTAHRRLAAIRAAYRASNTTEAVARWLAEGGLGGPGDGRPR
jgi:DNA-binding NarL/FixJ family response regulator